MSKKVQGITAQELHKRFHDAEKNDTYFEYECLCDGVPCVRSTSLGYCPILSEEEARKFLFESPDTFYPIVRADNGEEFSEHYDFYMDIVDESTEDYYAVRKAVKKS